MDVLLQFKEHFLCQLEAPFDATYPDLPAKIVAKNAALYTLVYLSTLFLLIKLRPLVQTCNYLTSILELGLHAVPTFLYFTQFNPWGLLALVYNCLPYWLRH